MMTAAKDLNRFLMIAAMTLGVNVVLFTGLPNLLPKATAPTDFDQIQTVDFIRRQPGQEQPRENERPEAPPPEPPRELPRNTTAVSHTQTPQQPQLEMPAFDFDVLPGMNMGVAVHAPVHRPAPVRTTYGSGEVDQIPTATVKPRPAYPYRARRLKIEGEVDVKFLVDHNGRVSRITVQRAAPPNLFEKSVIQALGQWRFTPGKVDGRAVDTWITTTIVFRMDEL
jgi:protein TonB